jgi:hypothetical protein
VSSHAAVTLSFSSKENFEELLNLLKGIDWGSVETVEQEYVFLHSHMTRRLSEEQIQPLAAYEPDKTHKELI